MAVNNSEDGWVLEGQPDMNFNAQVQRMEQQLLREALAENGHNQRRTAQSLGLSYDQLRGMVRKYGISTRHNQTT